jgi:catechol 2,3-dioxygenase-like lactoylglutathione lyase family enzyme
MAQPTASRETERHAFVKAVHGVRYQVKDVARSAAFYTQHLGFTLEHQQLPAFASVSLGDAQLLLSGPGASASRAMPNGQHQEPSGWNRVVLEVTDLSAGITALKNAGVVFATRWKRARVDDRSRSRIPTAIPLNCSSRPDRNRRTRNCS